MKKLYFLATALYFTGFMNASTHISTPVADNDVTLVSTKFEKYITIGSQNSIKAAIKNNGTVKITSVEVNWNDGTDHVATINTSVNAGASITITHPTKVSYSDVGTRNIVLTITKVNGVEDANPADNTLSFLAIVPSQTVPKKVVFEEGTGTWCGWCPRGMVALNKVNADYPDDQISIAVHNGDPMVLAAYNTGAAFSGFPGMNVDRELKGVDINPNSIGGYVTSRKSLLTPAKVDGDFSIADNKLTANVGAQFFMNNSNAKYRLAVVVTEDAVKGTASGYRQSNYYAGGSNGVMGGFETLPSVVPADQMIYDHVGRALLGGYAGQADSVPTAITDGQIVNYTFTYDIPAAYVQDKIHAVVLLLDVTDGTIVNAAKLTKTNLAVNDIKANAANTLIYPNPAKSDFNIKLTKDGSYRVVMYDVAGREIKNYGTVNSTSKTINLPINLTPGKYFVNISQDGNSVTKELLVK